MFGKKTSHVRHIHLAGRRDRDNNKTERLNGEIRDREKVFRGMKKTGNAILDGMRAYYSFAKRHGALDGRTTAEASRIGVDGRNKRKTMIQNAGLSAASGRFFLDFWVTEITQNPFRQIFISAGGNR